MPFATTVPETDTLLIPTGPLINVSTNAYNFLQPRSIGYAWNETLGYSGLGKLVSVSSRLLLKLASLTMIYYSGLRHVLDQRAVGVI